MTRQRTVMSLASGALLAFLMFSSPAVAQTCNPGQRLTQSTCPGDSCECASPCETNSECYDNCCVDGFCAYACACTGGGTVAFCDTPGGCGTVAPTGSPLSAMPMLWGFGLIGLGLAASARFVRKGGLRSAAAITSLTVCLLGAVVVTVAVLETKSAVGAKSLKQ